MSPSAKQAVPAPLRRLARRIQDRVHGEVSRVRYRRARPGTVGWLIKTEQRYGGFVSLVERRNVSPNDHRSEAALRRGGMTGGDRMSPLHNNYAPVYARHLAPFLDRPQPVLLCEVGILRGTGLAMWSDLFSTGIVLGLDVDLSHFEENTAFLRSRGAFRNGNVECFHYDQLVDTTERLGEILDGRTIDIVIDDGVHSDEAILKTMAAAEPHLAADFLYIVEDNDHVTSEIRRRYPRYRVTDYDVGSRGSLVVITPGSVGGA